MHHSGDATYLLYIVLWVVIKCTQLKIFKKLRKLNPSGMLGNCEVTYRDNASRRRVEPIFLPQERRVVRRDIAREIQSFNVIQRKLQNCLVLQRYRILRIDATRADSISIH